MKCQANGIDEATVEVASQSPDGPYHVSTGVAKRLQAYALRPREWFNLAAIHGPMEHRLHDDFYSDDGRACQPQIEVDDPDRFPCPTLEECSDSLARLLDFAVTRWHLNEPVTEVLRQHSAALLDAIRIRFAHTRNPWFHYRLTEIAGEVLGETSAEWFRTVIRDREPREQLRLLHEGHSCLPHVEGLLLAQKCLSSLPKRELAQQCSILMHYRDPSVLDWIEANVSDPLTTTWGDLAAVSQIDWARISRWLQLGRPLSLVALDAMEACGGPHPRHAFLIRRMKPRIQTDSQDSVIRAELTQYAERDRSPRVSKAVEYILDRFPAITMPR